MRYVFGNPNFESKEDAIEYLREELPSDNAWRYRHSLARNDADSILFSYNGELLAELVVDDAVAPSEDDLQEWDKTKKVYLIREVRLFGDCTLRAAALGLSRIQFGKEVPDDVYSQLIEKAGGFGEVISK